MFGKVFDFYYEKHKTLFFIPLILLAFNLGVLGYNYFLTGSIINADSTLTGGVTLTFTYDKPIDYELLNEHLINGLGTTDVDLVLLKGALSQESIGHVIHTEYGIEKERIIGLIEEFLGEELNEDSISFGSQSSVLGENFLRDALWLFFLGFLLMMLVSYIYFRDIIPAISITISTLADIIGVLAVFNLFGIKVGIITIGALLMIMGYSTDSDILLSTNILKRNDGSLKDRIFRAFKTELTMNSTALVTFLIMFLLSSVDAIKQISLVLIIGMFFDIFNTWLMNASMQRRYLDYKRNRK